MRLSDDDCNDFLYVWIDRPAYLKENDDLIENIVFVLIGMIVILKGLEQDG